MDASTRQLQRSLRRSAIFAAVITAHLALLLAILVPPRPRPQRHTAIRERDTALQVSLLSPTPATPPARNRPAPPRSPIATPPPHARPTPSRIRAQGVARVRAPPTTMNPATAATTAALPAFIAGGGFARRLQQAQATPPATRLPGGHHYLASDLEFIPVEQQSIAAKVHKVAALVGLGWFDPVCKNAEYELAKPRLQQIADGYTPKDLQRLLLEHHCQ